MLIGLAGFKRSGKDTLGNALVQGFGFTRFAFADALRQEVAELDGIPQPDDAHKDVRNATGQSYRDVLIARGQQRREQDPDYWVKALAHAVDAPPVPANVVLTDCRFPNEIAWVRSRGGVMVWVWREGVTSNGHVTERDWRDECDYFVENDWRDPADLARKLMLHLRADMPQRLAAA